MNTFKDEETVFAAAVRLPPAERQVYLDRACGLDGPMRQRLEALLKSYAASEQVLEKPAAPDLERAFQGPNSFDEQTGGSIGRYKLLQQIGEGGCGVVYMAEQEEPVRRRIALKVIKLGMDTRQVIARFEAERQALALMDHINIAKVLDAGATQAGRPYFVMELVRGVKITDYCDHNNLPIKPRLELFIQVCKAIQHAHQKGIIHRDIKPSNILVTLHDGVAVPKVIDFGIAKATQGRLTDMTLFTAFEQFMGTPAYTSPEQAEISGLDIDTRSDIYSLGVLLYELLTGKTPFDTQQLLSAGLDEVRRTIREQEPQRPSTKLSTMLEGELTATAKRHDTDALRLVSAVCGDLDWIVMKSLEKDRSRRYESANDLARDLERHLAHEPVLACPPSTTYQVRKFVRRNKIAVAAVCGVALALLGGIGVAGWQVWQKDLAYEKVVAAEREQRRLAVQAQEAEAAERENLYHSYIAQIRAGRLGFDAGQRRFGGLELAKKAARIRPSLELRNEALACLAVPDLKLVRAWNAGGFGPPVILFGTNSARYTTADLEGNISVRGAIDDQLYFTLPGPGYPLASIVESPGGQSLATGYFTVKRPELSDPKTGQIWDLITRRVIFKPEITNWATCAFTADERLIAVAPYEGPIILYERASGRELRRFSVEATPGVMGFDPGGRKLAVSSMDSTNLVVFRTESSEPVATLAHPAGSGTIRALSWHPNLDFLATGCDDSNIYLWDVSHGNRLAVLTGHEAAVVSICFSPDSRFLASASWDGKIKLWSLLTLKELCSAPREGYVVSFSSDGHWLANSCGLLKLFELNQADELKLLPLGLGRRAYGEGCGFSPDGQLLAVAASDGVRLWATDSGKQVGFVRTRRSGTAIFSAVKKALLTVGLEGIQERPYEWDGSQLKIGSPQLLGAEAAVTGSSINQAGDKLVLVRNGRVCLLDLETRTERLLAGTPAPDPAVITIGPAAAWFPNPAPGTVIFRTACLSPNAQLCAACRLGTNLVQVFDVATGAEIQTLEAAKVSDLAFSPDGRWLVTCGLEEYRFWDSRSWQCIRRDELVGSGGVHGEIAFSRDGAAAAVLGANRTVRLIACATGQELATLESSEPFHTGFFAFSPDGNLLAASGRRATQLWNLALIRKELGEMNLDWSLPVKTNLSGAADLADRAR